MINLPVSEAYAFDYLAILWVKADRGKDSKQYRQQVTCAIEESLNGSWSEVINSLEFHQLYEANAAVFDMIEKAMRDECSASAVVAANHRRYAAKKALQERFWPHEPLTEVKSKRPYESVT
jgi:hypothetical protein